MTIVHARKMRIYPTDMQKHKIDTTLNCCRFIYNKMLERNNKVYNRRDEHLNYYSMQNLLPVMKEYLPWLRDADSQALQQSCKDLNAGFDRFFKKTWKTSCFSFKERETVLSYYTESEYGC